MDEVKKGNPILAVSREEMISEAVGLRNQPLIKTSLEHMRI